MDIIFQRYLPECIISKLINDKKLSQYVIPAQNDYVCDEEYGPWIFNTKWCVMPSIAFLKTVPVMISFWDHRKGPISHMIHPCRQPLHILP